MPSPHASTLFSLRMMPSAPRRRTLLAAVLLLGTAVLGGCNPEPAHPDFVARVGDQYLTRDDLSDALAALPVPQDSAEAHRQVVEQWITNQLLYQEALDRGLDRDPEVRRLLEESKRSVLVSALISRMYEENPATPSPAELQAYFESNRDQLRLLEPFVRVRYLATSSADEAAAARRLLQQTPSARQDSVWSLLVRRYAEDEDAARSLAENYFAESRLFINQPALRTELNRLRPEEVAPIFEADSLYHLLQLVARVPAGTVPEPAWIEDELTRRLVIQARKQLYARQVQRLRNEALAREALDVR